MNADALAVTGPAAVQSDHPAALASALRVLDRVLGQAVRDLAGRLGAASLLDPWRGLHLEQADVERLLTDSTPAPGAPATVAGALAAAARAVPSLTRLAARERLPDIDLALVLIALAPDADLKYEKVYGYLHDDVTRKRATPDLCANLLACDAAQRLRVLARLDADAPLVRGGIVDPKGDLRTDPRATTDLPWLACPLSIDGSWRNMLLGGTGLDADLAPIARRVDPAATTRCTMSDDTQVDAARRALARSRHLLVSGPHGAGKFDLALAVARANGEQVLVVDIGDLGSAADVRATLRRVGAAARSTDARPFLHGTERMLAREPRLHRALFAALGDAPVACVVASVAPLMAAPGCVLDAVRLQLEPPPAAARHGAWEHALARRGLRGHAQAVRDIADRFVLGAGQIEQACADLAAGPASERGMLSYTTLALAARAQGAARLGALARRITPEADLETLVLPAELRAQLREICARVGAAETLRRDWGAGCVHARGRGVCALFAGPSGTGKTLAAEAIACELGYDLYRIDLAAIVSKYIGETEQNLDRVFTAAEHANAVLFFDEADALFGRRSEVKDAHDRYANIEVAYLLQKIEQFDGLAVLATNLKQNLDDAFARRLTFSLNFPFPEAAQRRQLWEALWPPRAPRAADVDVDGFAREYRLAGGNIRNVILAAAFLASAEGTAIGRAHLLHALRREFQKLGKTMADPAVAPAPARRGAA